jgi:hypothetical protein
MAKQWQIRRGTTAENDDFTGAIGELTMDTDTKGVRIHDGSTQGGFQIDTVVAFQKPTAENNYTWSRLYSSGWVEQGGRKKLNGAAITVDIPVSMSDTNFTVLLNATSNDGGWPLVWERSSSRTTSSFYVDGTGKLNDAVRTIWFDWEVKGMAA